MSQAERKKFIRTLVQLKEQEGFLAKSLQSFLLGMKVETDVIQDLILTREQCTIERKKITDAIYRIGSNICNDLEIVKSIVGRVNEEEKIDPEELKSKLIFLSKRIKEFQPVSQLEILVAEQKELEEALHDFRMKIHEFEKPNCGSRTAYPRKNSLNRKDIGVFNYDEIKDFDSLVIKTGHTQHWKEEDHLFFLKVRKKNSNVPSMVHSIRQKCPDLTAEEIINHEVWYKVYLALREKQKNIVKEWRKKKDSEKLGKIRSLKSSNDELIGNKFPNASGDSNNSIITASNKLRKKIKPFQSHMEPDGKKELIKKWKIEKENAKLANEERLRIQSEGIRAWKEQQFLLRNIEIQSALEDYRTKKMHEKLSEEQIKTANCTKIVKTPELIRSFRERDSNYLRKRQNILNSKHKKNPNVELNTSSARSRSSSTLLKPTKIWEERCRQKSTPQNSPKAVLYIKNLPRLSICNWKNQESMISL